MSANGYRFLGYLVWNGSKWYLRRRLPPPRVVGLSAAGAAGLLAGGAVLARRAVG